MTCVLDASAASSVIFRRGEYNSIIDLLSEAELIIAPDLYFSEMLSVIWKTLRWTDDDSVGAGELCRRAFSLLHDSVPVIHYWQRVIDLSTRENHSPYDMAYAVLAERSNGTLLTLDRKLARISGILGIPVRIWGSPSA